MARGQGTVTVKFLGDLADLQQKTKTAGDDVGGFGDKMSGVAGKVAGAFAGLGVVDFLKGATEAAAEDQAAHEKLATSLRNSIGAWDGQIDSIEKWITKMQFSKGFSDNDLRTSMEQLVNVTHNVADAQNLAGVAMDLARAKGIPLADATSILAKAHEGNTKAIKAQFPEIGKLIKDNASADEIISTLTNTVKGQADTFAGTAAGKAEIFHQKMGELTESIGSKLLPVMVTLTDWLSKVVDFFSGLPGPVQAGIVVVTGIAAALFALNSILGLATAAAAAFGITLELSLGPIALVVAAIAGLIAIGVLVVNNWDTIKAAAAAVFDWVKDHWPLLLGIITGPIGLAVAAIVTHWDKIKNGFTAVKDWIGDRVGDIVGFFTGLPGRIAAAAVGMWDGIKDAFRGVINTIIGWWNGLDFKLPSVHIPGTPFDVGGFTLGTPDIPRLAAGGIVTRPTLALIGERGPEAVVPLGGGMAGTVVNNYFYGPQDPAGVARQIQSMLLEEKRRSGPLGLT